MGSLPVRISLYIAMGMVMRNHDLVDSNDYPYGFAPGIDPCRDVVEDRDIYASVSISTELLALRDDLYSSINFSRESVKEDIVSSLLRLSLSFGPNPREDFQLLLLPCGLYNHLLFSVQGATREVNSALRVA
ncbi:hypothetical protein AYI68_g4259 [Smittium mucronatum]|uniref:Uncharacterized protein n=1 Tax=Smittium mucronatum TaxID=133383 RepID=A0A1R0GWC4_9FUNG|nr:hypothetical protein AYI68_g4692 [Smittium mucronatum]OLY81630.1 hypothetical protein AYI68_g4259 [Smittium mucronatum]